jgi:predicted phosphohydrolase
MKIKLISDLHLEFCKYTIPYDGEDILILAGDAGTDIEDTKTLIIQYLEKSTGSLIFVPGNHEYWGHTIGDIDTYWSNFKTDRFYFLQNNSVVINNIRFFGSTMWTDLGMGNRRSMEICELMVRDFTEIKQFNSYKFIELHETAKKALEQTIKTSKELIVVITHHLPSEQGIDKKYYGNPVNDSFASSDLEHIFINKKILLYCHGHTHTSMSYDILGVKVHCNPRGYVKYNKTENTYTHENPIFDDHKILVI